jgi:hypothetical protein
MKFYAKFAGTTGPNSKPLARNIDYHAVIRSKQSTGTPLPGVSQP